MAADPGAKQGSMPSKRPAQSEGSGSQNQAGASGGQGQRHRQGARRGQPQRDSTPRAAKFEGRYDNLAGHIYDYTNLREAADQFTKTMREVC
jgi:hypothetical protein